MEGGPHRLELVLRRWRMDYEYSSLGSPAWTPFEDLEHSGERTDSICSKRPENRRFEVLTERGAALSPIIVHTCRPNVFYRGTTPWGDLEIKKTGLTRYEVLRGASPLATVKEKLSGLAAIVFFQSDRELHLKGMRLWYSKMRAQTDTGEVSIVSEHGRRPNPGPNRHKTLRRKDYRSLTESERKAVIENDVYTQWRISFDGSLPARDDEILAALSMCICRSCLYAEYVAATSGWTV